MTTEPRRWWRGRKKSSVAWHIATVINDKVASECPPHYEMPTTGELVVGDRPPGRMCGNCASYLKRPMRATKMCSRCKQVKSFTEFYQNRKSADGLHSWCSECFNKDRRDKRGGGKRQRSKDFQRPRTNHLRVSVDDETAALVEMASDYYNVTKSYLLGVVIERHLAELKKDPRRFLADDL